MEIGGGVFRAMNPEGIQIIQPRVARNELPWVHAINGNNPEGVASTSGAKDSTPLGLKMILDR